jgi:hypothetical protein
MENIMKTCVACGIKKPLNDYYRNARMADGHLSQCKECQKAASRAARYSRLDLYDEAPQQD